MSEVNIRGQLTQVDENGNVSVLHPYVDASQDIVEGVLPIERGGTGANTSAELKSVIRNTIGLVNGNSYEMGLMSGSDKSKLDKISTKSLYSIPYFTAGQPAAGVYYATGDNIEFVDGAQLILDSSSGMTIGPTLSYMGSKLAFRDSSENWNEKIIMYNGTKSVDMPDSEPLKLKKGKYLFKYSSYYNAVELIGRIPEPVETTDIMIGANQYSSGEAGLVPAPTKNQYTYFLRGDGTWAQVVDNDGNIVATPNVDSATGKLAIEHGGTGETTVEGIKTLVGTNYSNQSTVDNLKRTLGINYYKTVGDDASDSEVDLNNYIDNGKYYFLQTLVSTGRITNAPAVNIYPLNVFSNSQLTTFYLFVLAVDNNHTKQIISIYGSNPKTHIIFTRTRFKDYDNNTYSWSEWVQVLTGKDIPVNRKTDGSIGTNSVSLGHNGTASGNYSVALGNTNTSSGENSTTSGSNNTASGIGSVALGASNTVNGNYSIGLGNNNKTDGVGCIAIGHQVTTDGVLYQNNAIGIRSIAIGAGNTSGVENDDDKHGSIAIGRQNTNTGRNATAIGVLNTVSGDNAVALGNTNMAIGTNSTTSGYQNQTVGNASIALGYQNNYNSRSKDYSTALGYRNNYNNTTGAGKFSVALGNTNITTGENSTASGSNNTAYGIGSVALGGSNEVGGNHSFALGRENKISENATSSGALGYNNTITGDTADNTFTLGYKNKSTSPYSIAIGYNNTTNYKYSVALGYGNTTNESGSLAMGYLSTTGGYCSSALGYHLTTNSACSLVTGRYDSPKSGSNTAGYTDNRYDAFIIGNGYLDSSTGEQRKNAFRVKFDGTTYGTGAFNTSGADYAEFIKPWFDNNIENEDRVGYMVTIKDGYLHKANEGDYIIGITSGNPSVVGNGDEDYYWKYERDEFNRTIYHEIDEIIEEKSDDGNTVYTKTGKKITVPKISSDYNPELQSSYIERSKRPEWSYVGMRGIIPVRDDGTCEAGGFCKCGSNGIATRSERGLDTYYVIERINDHVVSVEVK